MSNRILNIADIELESIDAERAPKGDNAALYDIRWGEIASRVGARKLGYSVTVVAPGKRNCPFHNHRVEEEMFYILEGTGELRLGDTRHPIRAGDVIACPPGGPETAHQIINTGTIEMRYLCVSTMESPDICEYPDSGKYLIYAAGGSNDGESGRFRVIGRESDSLDYWDGE
jgi:uncharacterized cupin superfamily protein